MALARKDIRAKLDDDMKLRVRTPRTAYGEHKRRARLYGIEWLFTFDSWWAMWDASGRWALRGIHAGCYAMTRPNDRGPYGPENVVIGLASQNSHDARANNPEQAQRTAIQRTGKGRGWTFVEKCTTRPFQVCVAKKYIGNFATQAEAEQAHALACATHRAELVDRLRRMGLAGNVQAMTWNSARSHTGAGE